YPRRQIIRPSALTFLEAFQSRRWWVRQPGQDHSRSESERLPFLNPHSEQSFVDGKNRSTRQSACCSKALCTPPGATVLRMRHLAMISRAWFSQAPAGLDPQNKLPTTL